MADEKLTVRKLLAIIGWTTIGTLGFCLLYLTILFCSLPFTLNGRVSWILSLSITMGLMLLLGRYLLKRKGKKV